MKTAGATMSVFFVGASHLIRGGQWRSFISFFYARDAFVAAIVDVIAGLPILSLMGLDCQETLCMVR